MFKITQAVYEKDALKIFDIIYKKQQINISESILCHILPHLENYKGRIYAKKIEIFNKEFKININSNVSCENMYNVLRYCASWIRCIHIYGQRVQLNISNDIATLEFPKLRHLVLNCMVIPKNFKVLLDRCHTTLQTLEHNLECSLLDNLWKSELVFPKLWKVKTTSQIPKDYEMKYNMIPEKFDTKFPLLIDIDAKDTFRFCFLRNDKEIYTYHNGPLKYSMGYKYMYLHCLIQTKMILNRIVTSKDLRLFLWNVIKNNIHFNHFKDRTIHSIKKKLNLKNTFLLRLDGGKNGVLEKCKQAVKIKQEIYNYDQKEEELLKRIESIKQKKKEANDMLDKIVQELIPYKN
jgi:hypothetical protein